MRERERERERHGTGGKVKKEENDAGGPEGHSRSPVGSRGKVPGRGLGATPPDVESFFQYVITKNSILEHENQIFASQ